MKEYYCLKEGKRGVNGRVIELDTDEMTIKETTNFEKDFQPKFKHLKKIKEGDVYQLILKHFKYDIGATIFTGQKFCRTLPAGSDLKLELLVKKTEIVRILSKNIRKTKIYLEKINEKQAKDLADSAFFYSVKMDYICGA